MKRWTNFTIRMIFWTIGICFLIISDSYNLNLIGAFIMGTLFALDGVLPKRDAKAKGDGK